MLSNYCFLLSKSGNHNVVKLDILIYKKFLKIYTNKANKLEKIKTKKIVDTAFIIFTNK